MIEKSPWKRRHRPKLTILSGGDIVEVPSTSRAGKVHRVKPKVPYCPCERWEHTNYCNHYRLAQIALKKAGYIG